MASDAPKSQALTIRRHYRGLGEQGEMIAVRARPKMFACLDLFAPGWPWEEGKSDRPCAFELAAVRDTRTSFRITRGGLAEDGLAFGRSSAAALLSATLALGAVARRPDLILLHAAAVATEKGLVALMGETGTGKSTLAYFLGQAGAGFFCDDRLGVNVEQGEGLSLGLAPKLRFPLPPGVLEQLAVPPRRKLSWVGAALVDPPAQPLPAFGQAQKLAACIFLQRDTSTQPASLTPMPGAEAFHKVLDLIYLGQNQQLDGALATRGVFAEMPVYRLRFSDTADAASSLLAQFGRIT